MKSIAAAVTLALLLSNSALAAPRIHCANSEWKFGTVGRDQALKHTWTIQNTGDSELQIRKVRMCCGASYKLGSETIPPGTNTTLDINLSLKGRRGRLRKSIYVISNDKKQPYLQLRLLGAVVASADVVPHTLLFKGGESHSVMEREVRMVCRGSVMMKVTNVLSSTKYFAGKVLPTKVDGSEVIRVQTVPPLPAGTTTGQIHVFTDHPKHKMFKVEATAIVPSRFVVVPRVVYVKTREEEPVAYTVAIRARNGKTFKILDVTTPESDMQVETMPLGKAGYRCVFSNIRPRPELNGKKIIIATDSEPTGKISIPIRVVAK